MDVGAQAYYLAGASSRAVAIRFLNDFDAALARLRESPRIGTLWPTDNPEPILTSEEGKAALSA